LQKTAHYRRASHFDGQSMFLQAAINSCQDNYKSHGFPVFKVKNDLDCIVAKHKTDAGCDFLHLVTYERGAGAAVIETITNTSVTEQPAPNTKEFIQSQVFILCSGDNVLWTTHSNALRDSAVAVLINELIKSFGGFVKRPMYVFEANLDEKMFRRLMDEGIQEIDLAVGGYKDTLDYLRSGGKMEEAGLFSVLKSALSKKISKKKRQAASKISARVVLRPGRDWADPKVKELMAEMASNVLNEMDDGFIIVTKNGLRVTHDSLKVKDDFHVDGNKRVVDVNQIHTKLLESFAKLEGMGVFEN